MLVRLRIPFTLSVLPVPVVEIWFQTMVPVRVALPSKMLITPEPVTGALSVVPEMEMAPMEKAPLIAPNLPRESPVPVEPVTFKEYPLGALLKKKLPFRNPTLAPLIEEKSSVIAEAFWIKRPALRTPQHRVNSDFATNLFM